MQPFSHSKIPKPKRVPRDEMKFHFPNNPPICPEHGTRMKECHQINYSYGCKVKGCDIRQYPRWGFYRIGPFRALDRVVKKGLERFI